jgi:lipid-A-disaccharide synthase
MTALRIGMIAGEASGDLLGAGLIHALRKIHPDITVEGIAGSQMQAAGATSLFPMEKLSVIGFSEVLLRVRELLSMRTQTKKHFLNNPPDIFIGIDAPDFNLPIELALKKANILTVQYNSPTIWAWRYKRIFKMVKAVNLMLCLFPFEAPYYEAVQIPVRYIGHPLADLIPLQPDQAAARKLLNLPIDAKIIALLPGSRFGEIKYLGPVLLRAAQLCLAQKNDLIFISPMINAERKKQFELFWKTISPNLPLTIFEGQSRTVMAAADVIALASGTATLEAMLLKKPMVVAYKGSAFSYFIAKHLVKIKQFSLPNILAGEKLVPEFLQHTATAENICHAVMNYFNDLNNTAALIKRFAEIHLQLKCNANERAAEAVIKLINKNKI